MIGANDRIGRESDKVENSCVRIVNNTVPVALGPSTRIGDTIVGFVSVYGSIVIPVGNAPVLDVAITSTVVLITGFDFVRIGRA